MATSAACSRAARVAQPGPARVPRPSRRRLAEGELVDLLAEVGARRGPHAPDGQRPALAQVELVQIGLEDALLRIAPLHQRGQPRFADLAEVRAPRGEEAILHELLRD